MQRRQASYITYSYISYGRLNYEQKIFQHASIFIIVHKKLTPRGYMASYVHIHNYMKCYKALVRSSHR